MLRNPDTSTLPAEEPSVPHIGASISALLIYQKPDRVSVDVLRDYLMVLEQISNESEIILVVNGDIDLDPEIQNELARSGTRSVAVKIHRKSDESVAIRAGLKATQSDLVILLPNYRQVDPWALGTMVEVLEEGYDYVASWRCPRVDSRWSAFKSVTFNRVTRWLTKVPLHDVNSSLRVFRRNVAEDLPFYGEMHRFLPVLAAMNGFRVTEVKVKHLHERVRKGDFRFGVYVRRILDLLSLFFLFKFVKKPLRFFGLIGNACIAVGAVVTGVVAAQRIWGGVELSNRPALLLGVLLIVLGVQLFSLGLLGELIIFIHGRHVPDQYVETVYEFDPVESKGRPV